MSSLSELRFLTTPPHECSYLEDRQAVTLFADPLAKIDTQLYTMLSASGFRRSGSHIYRPHCPDCRACIPTRIPVDTFKSRRNQKRVWSRNQDLASTWTNPRVSDEIYDLYERYINERHADGDMFPATKEQFESFLVDGRPEARFFETRLDGDLVSVAVADHLNDGLSAVYIFFDPDLDKRSLGTFSILELIEETRRLNRSYLYLGYWIKQCSKMSYKMDFKPLEVFVNDSWSLLLN